MTGHAFHHQPDRRAKGREGEEEGRQWLRERGYRIVETNFTTRSGEIDAIAREGDTLCFIEIKARANRACGPAIEAVPIRKQSKVARVASLYLAQHPWDGPCRFDVLAMDLGDEGWAFHLVRDAFQVPG